LQLRGQLSGSNPPMGIKRTAGNVAEHVTLAVMMSNGEVEGPGTGARLEPPTVTDPSNDC